MGCYPRVIVSMPLSSLRRIINLMTVNFSVISRWGEKGLGPFDFGGWGDVTKLGRKR